MSENERLRSVIPQNCAYRAGGTNYLKLVEANFISERSCYKSDGWSGLVTEETGERSRARPCDIYGRQNNIQTGFPSSTSVFSVSVSQSMLHSHLKRNITLIKRTNWRSLGTFKHGDVFADIRHH